MGKIILVITGVIVLLLLLVEVISLIGSYRFSQEMAQEVQAFYKDVKNDHHVIKERDLLGLPVAVENWLKNAQVIGKEKIVTAWARQTLQMRLDKEKPWMPAKAEQYFRTEEPGFIWAARIKAAPFFHIAGRDRYLDGHGNMLIKIMSLLTIADASGPEIDQGTLLRYLAETIWFPTAALSDYIEWEELTSYSSKATMNYQGVCASGIFTFNDQGELVKVEAERYGDFDGEYRLENWLVEVADYKEFDGFVIPSRGKIIWKLKTGDFEWYHFEVEDMKYNQL